MICRERRIPGPMRKGSRRMPPAAAIPSAVVAALALLTAAPVVDGQQSGRSARAQVAGEAQRGWIGVSFDMSGDRRGWTDAIIVTDVRSGSPAAEAGLRPGDRVVAVNQLETPRELAALPELLRLRVGDPVVMVVERDGNRRRFRMRAAPRPTDFTPSRSVRVAVRADSVVESWARSMDSLSVRLRTVEAGDDVRIYRARGEDDEARARLTVVGGLDRGVRVPFEFFVFRGEAHDSLHQEMMQVNALVARLQEQIQARERELRARLGSTASGQAVRDAELMSLQAKLQQVSARSARLESAMAEAARENAGLAYHVARSDAGRTPSAESTPVSSGEFRPLTPYLLGRNRVAGAEVIDLEPQLARYFDVDGGVLITRVAEGTPAGIAGLVPGDVITRIDQVAVRAVEDLRLAVSAAGDTVPLTLIRDGRSRQVVLRKR